MIKVNESAPLPGQEVGRNLRQGEEGCKDGTKALVKIKPNVQNI